MPLLQSERVLGQVVGARRDEARDTAVLRFRAAGVGDQEDDSVAARLRVFGCDGVTKQRLALLETGYKFLPVLGLECRVRDFVNSLRPSRQPCKIAERFTGSLVASSRSCIH